MRPRTPSAGVARPRARPTGALRPGARRSRGAAAEDAIDWYAKTPPSAGADDDEGGEDGRSGTAGARSRWFSGDHTSSQTSAVLPARMWFSDMPTICWPEATPGAGGPRAPERRRVGQSPHVTDGGSILGRCGCVWGNRQACRPCWTKAWSSSTSCDGIPRSAKAPGAWHASLRRLGICERAARCVSVRGVR